MVEVISVTHSPLETAYKAARRCYSEDPKTPAPASHEDMTRLVNAVVGMGHTGILESVVFVFHVEGISRTASHQLVRHRMAGYCQQSQRYAPVQGGYVIPQSVGQHGFTEEYADLMEQARSLYDRMCEAGVPREDARYIIPHCSKTSLTVCMNARELYDVFFPKRLCMRAQWEIRSLAQEMLTCCREHFPEIFSHAGAFCDMEGYCPEGRMCCGRSKTLHELTGGAK